MPSKPEQSAVTTYLSDYNAAGSAYYVQSDDYAGAPTRNSSGTDGNCNDWFIDPIPVINADGSTNPGQTVARLNLVNARPSRNYTDGGDFYVTFSIHVTVSASPRWPSTRQSTCIQAAPADQSTPEGQQRLVDIGPLPASCQSRKRRQQVMPDPHPSSWGSISQGTPLRNTNTIPARHARSAKRGLPPLGLALGVGMKSSMTSGRSAAGIGESSWIEGYTWCWSRR